MTGFGIAALVQTAGSILGSLAQKTPKQQRTWQDSWYGTLIKKGAANARRANQTMETAAFLTGRPKSDFIGSTYYHEKNNKLFDESLSYGYSAAADVVSTQKKRQEEMNPTTYESEPVSTVNNYEGTSSKYPGGRSGMPTISFASGDKAYADGNVYSAENKFISSYQDYMKDKFPNIYSGGE